MLVPLPRPMHHPSLGQIPSWSLKEPDTGPGCEEVMRIYGLSVVGVDEVVLSLAWIGSKGWRAFGSKSKIRAVAMAEAAKERAINLAPLLAPCSLPSSKIARSSGRVVESRPSSRGDKRDHLQGPYGRDLQDDFSYIRRPLDPFHHLGLGLLTSMALTTSGSNDDDLHRNAPAYQNDVLCVDHKLTRSQAPFDRGRTMSAMRHQMRVFTATQPTRHDRAAKYMRQ